jgi:hypothetical protein
MGHLEMNNSKFNGNLNDVDLKTARITGQLNIIGSKFKGKLNMNGLRVVDLRGARIGDQLSIKGSNFNGKLDMDSLQVDGSLLMRNRAVFAEVDLRGARIGHELTLDGLKFKGNLNMESLWVGEHLFMRGSMVEKPATLLFSNINGSLNISGSKLSSLDLTGTKIKKELYLGSQNIPPVTWNECAKLTLRNTEVGALQDLPVSWPDKLELAGFTYSRLGGFGVGEGKSMADRDVSWLKEWLEKQKHYLPQPYEHLTKVLKEAGHKKKSNEILYAGKERERKDATGLYKYWLSFLKITIGYGFYSLYLLIWIAILTLLGALVLELFGEGPANNIPNYIAYSLDMLLPIIRLDEFHYDAKFSLTYMGTIVQLYFYFHKIMGYFLASVLIAGLSGITKK